MDWMSRGDNSVMLRKTSVAPDNAAGLLPTARAGITVRSLAVWRKLIHR